MRHIDYYVKQQESAIPEMIKQRLEKGPVTVEGKLIESEGDLQLKSVLAAIRIASRRKGRELFNEAKKDSYRFVQPKPGQKLNGIPLEDGIVLPIVAPEILEDHEITIFMIASGLFTALRAEFDDYYYKLLCGFNLDALPANLKEEIEGMGSEEA